MPQQAARRLAELLTQRWRDNTGAGKTPTKWYVSGPTVSLSGKRIAEALLSPADLFEYNVEYTRRAQRQLALSGLERLKRTARYKELTRLLSEPSGIDNIDRLYAQHMDILLATIHATPPEIRLHNQLIGERAERMEGRLRELCDGLARRKHGQPIGYTLTRIDGETENNTNGELDLHTLPPLETSWLVIFHPPNRKALTSRRE